MGSQIHHWDRLTFMSYLKMNETITVNRRILPSSDELCHHSKYDYPVFYYLNALWNIGIWWQRVRWQNFRAEEVVFSIRFSIRSKSAHSNCLISLWTGGIRVGVFKRFFLTFSASSQQSGQFLFSPLVFKINRERTLRLVQALTIGCSRFSFFWFTSIWRRFGVDFFWKSTPNRRNPKIANTLVHP